MKTQDQKVWEWEIRLFHWLLVLSILGAYLTTMRENLLLLHAVFGSLAAGLILFRVGWGFIGGKHGRFSAFVLSPKQIWNYFQQLLQRKPVRYLTHNPLAGIAVLFFLFLISTIVFSGLVALWGQEKIGYLAHWFPLEMGIQVAHFHHEVSELLLLLIAVHLMGVFVDTWMHRENIIRSMFNGRKKTQSPELDQEELLRGKPHFLLYACSLSLFFLLMTIQWTSPASQVQGEKVASVVAAKLYQDECGACHLDFHPSLLPSRSWEVMMDNLSDHFGEDAALAAEETQKLRDYLINNASESFRTEASYKISHSLDKKNNPLSITQAGYWQRKHHEISKEIFLHKKVRSKLNCTACHPGAGAGKFEDASISIPTF